MTARQMSETQLGQFLLTGHEEVMRRVHDMSARGAGLLEVLQSDHQAVMERLDRICKSKTSDLSKVRAEFLEMKCILEAHSMAEERVLYAKLKQNKGAMELALEAGAEHELVARTLEDMSSLDLDPKPWMTLANTLRELVREHVTTEESEIFEQARRLFKDEELKEMGGQMQYEKTRIFAIVA
jgi:hemerythrin superfamily protein